MKSNNATPLVSVAVMAYNSAETIIETLESVKAQTYQRLELVIGDDGSKDNTTTLCREWIAKNKERFERVELLANPINKGQSFNYNRVMDACQGMWVKDLDADDLLLPNCIEDCIDYVQSHDNVSFLFGRLSAFGDDKEFVKDKERGFEYTFFSLTPEQQLDKLFLEGNVLPAPTFFYNLKDFKALGVRNDERIPLIEDWPKWINLLKTGVHFDFIDKVLIAYRIGGISTKPYMSEKYFISLRMMWFIYQYPYWVEKFGLEAANKEIIRQEYRFYKSYVDNEKKYLQVTGSHAYKFGKIIVKPLSVLLSVYNKFCNVIKK